LLNREPRLVIQAAQDKLPVILHVLLQREAASLNTEAINSSIECVRRIVDSLLAERHANFSKRPLPQQCFDIVQHYFMALARVELDTAGSMLGRNWPTATAAPMPYDRHYVYLSMRCALAVAEKYPEVLQEEQVLAPFCNLVAAFELREPTVGLRSRLSDALRTLVRHRISAEEHTKKGLIDKTLGELVTLIRQLQTRAFVNAKHPHPLVHATDLVPLQQRAAEYDICMQHMALDLLLHFGPQLLIVGDEDDAGQCVKAVWRPELVAMLMNAQKHTAADVRLRAIEVDTVSFVAASRGSGTAPRRSAGNRTRGRGRGGRGGRR